MEEKARGLSTDSCLCAVIRLGLDSVSLWVVYILCLVAVYLRVVVFMLGLDDVGAAEI